MRSFTHASPAALQPRKSVSASPVSSRAPHSLEAPAAQAAPAMLHSISRIRMPDNSKSDSPRQSFAQAIQGATSPLPYRAAMESAFGEDFSSVRTHLGQAVALHPINANAAASREEIAFASATPDRRQIAHELTHVVQHRHHSMPSTPLSQSSDSAEREASDMAPRIAAGEHIAVRQPPSATIHRDIKDKDLKVPMGHFEIDMAQVNQAGSNTGETGHISFFANDKSPDTNSIRLSQAAKIFDVKTNDDVQFQSKTALNTMSTVATAGSSVEKGFFLDHNPKDAAAKVRTSKTDKEVPRDYVWPGEEVSGKNQHGSKAGKTIVPAVLGDTPTSQDNRHFKYTFETMARSVDKGLEYGAIRWGFDADGKTGTVSGETPATVSSTVSDTYHAALDNFNKFYKNPHTVMAAENLASIALKYYGDPAKSSEIQKANQAIIPKDGKLTPGMKLEIPIIGP